MLKGNVKILGSNCLSCRDLIGPLVLFMFWVTATMVVNAQLVPRPQLRIAILGNPDINVKWNDEELEALKKIGFNAIQLNIAWGGRPFGEALNLEDVVTAPGEIEKPRVAAMRSDLKARAAMAKRHGFLTIFQFGSPYVNWDPYTGKVRRACQGCPDDTTFDSWYDIRNPLVVQHARVLLEEFRRDFPDVDDIEVYTYDQNAWQTPEFQEGTYSFGIPLSDRLPEYLKSLYLVWTNGRHHTHRMWWEPWELSAGQVYTILPHLPRTNFGLMIHGDIAEAQLALPVDLWFRNTVRICQKLGIPVVAEAFWTSHTEEIQPLSIPAPRLVDEQYLRMMQVPGIMGIKEYYGIIPDAPDPNLDVLRLRLNGFKDTTNALLTRIASRYVPAEHNVQKYFNLLSDAYQMYPWDATWLAREIGHSTPDHGWAGATIRGEVANTPDWRATRNAIFMMTTNVQPSFWMLEDVQLRCQVTAKDLKDALSLGKEIIGKVSDPKQKEYFEAVQRNAEYWRRITLSYAFHLRETNIAELLRIDIRAGKPLDQNLLGEMKDLLDADVRNQDSTGKVVEMRRLFEENPKAFVDRYLIPTEATPIKKGYFAFTTR